MTPQQTIKHMILILSASWKGVTLDADLTGQQVDKLYEVLVATGDHWDAMNEIRCGEVETGVEERFSRHYESKSVASKATNGQWVGWTYWYGGGKHGEPEAIEWIEDAYFLDRKEEQKTVTFRTFTKSVELPL